VLWTEREFYKIYLTGYVTLVKFITDLITGFE
jgi:hypothetical protein